jgi:hypothetical protein
MTDDSLTFETAAAAMVRLSSGASVSALGK